MCTGHISKCGVIQRRIHQPYKHHFFSESQSHHIRYVLNFPYRIIKLVTSVACSASGQWCLSVQTWTMSVPSFSQVSLCIVVGFLWAVVSDSVAWIRKHCMGLGVGLRNKKYKQKLYIYISMRESGRCLDCAFPSRPSVSELCRHLLCVNVGRLSLLLWPLCLLSGQRRFDSPLF